VLKSRNVVVEEDSYRVKMKEVLRENGHFAVPKNQRVGLTGSVMRVRRG